MGSSASDSDDEDSDGFSFVTSSTFDTFSLVYLLFSFSGLLVLQGFLLTQKMMRILRIQKMMRRILIWTFSQVSPLQGFPLQTWFLLLQIQMMRILMAFPL